MMDRPLHRRIHLSWLSQEVGPPLDNVASANNLIKAGFKLYRPEKPWSFVNALYWRKRI